MAKAILMCGLPGAGKTVFAKQLAKKRGYKYISIDDMYKAFNGSDCCRDNKFDVWMAFWRQIHLIEEANIDVVIDTNAPTPDDRNELLNWFSSFEWHLVWVNADYELCKKNNANRDRIIPEEHLQYMFDFFVRPRPNEDHYARAHWKNITVIKNENNHFKVDKIWGYNPYEQII